MLDAAAQKAFGSLIESYASATPQAAPPALEGTVRAEDRRRPVAAPVVHIWYLRGTRSWLAYLLGGLESREEIKAKQLAS